MGLVPYQAPASLDQVKRLVLDAVSSPSTRTMYGKALDDFFLWREEQGRPAFSRAAVQAHRAALESKGYSPSTINQRLAAVKKLAREAAANGLLAAEMAAGIDQVAGVKQQGTRVGNWLTRAQAEALINSPDPETLKGQRDRALLALLVGCGLRRAEAAGLTAGHIQQRDGRWVIVDLPAQHGSASVLLSPSRQGPGGRWGRRPGSAGCRDTARWSECWRGRAAAGSVPFPRPRRGRAWRRSFSSQRHLYGREWLTVIRPRVLERAHYQCESCRKPLHAWIFTYTWKTRDPQFSGAPGATT
jgi:integrase